MINFDYITKENLNEYNPTWPQIPDLPYRILITGGPGSGKTNALFNLIGCQPIYKIYSHPFDHYLDEVGWLACSSDLEGYADWSYVSW